MFSLRDYILKLLDDSIGEKPDYKVRELALGWYEKDVLVLADLEAIDSLIEAQYETVETPVEEITETVETLEESEE